MKEIRLSLFHGNDRLHYSMWLPLYIVMNQALAQMYLFFTCVTSAYHSIRA
jgi:hypothetical protein